MKRLLPILTAVLALTTTTASAAYYYDYYLNPPSTKPVDNNPDGYHNQSDSFTYGTKDNNGNVIANPDVFTVNRESNWGNDITRYGSKDNFFRIDIGKENASGLTLYLTDFVSEVVPQAAYLPTYSSSNALFNMDIVEYGYRTLTLDAETGKYIPGDTVTRDVFVSDGENKVLNSEYVTPIDSIDYYDDGREMIRYKYELGTFTKGEIIEVYMKDSSGREVYSFSSYSDEDGEAVYTPFDKDAPAEDVVARGNGFGDGGYRVSQQETDKMLYSYYFVDEINGQTNADYHDYTKFDENLTLASGKAMPLSHLTPININIEGGNQFGLGTQVAFGIYGVTAGRPLPGGLQIALIAGFFGLGFCYVRRRKAIAG